MAFYGARGVFLLVADRRDPGPTGRGRPTVASTYRYDPDANTYARLPNADLEAVGMNYMMAWDRAHGVFLFVTGTRDGIVTVWALRLDR